VTQGTVNVTSTAEIGPAGTVYNPFPIGMQYCGASVTPPCPYAVGAPPVAMTGKQAGGTAPGNWGPVTFPNGDAVYCTSGACTSVQSNTGCAAINDAIAALSVGETITVPLVDWTGVTGTKSMNVYGFATFVVNSITSGSGCSVDAVVTGTFVDQVLSGQIDTTGGATDAGSFSEKLIQ